MGLPRDVEEDELGQSHEDRGGAPLATPVPPPNPNHARIVLSVGKSHGFGPERVLAALDQLAGVEHEDIERIIMESHKSMVDVQASRAKALLDSLGGAGRDFAGHRIRAERG